MTSKGGGSAGVDGHGYSSSSDEDYVDYGDVVWELGDGNSLVSWEVVRDLTALLDDRPDHPAHSSVSSVRDVLRASLESPLRAGHARVMPAWRRVVTGSRNKRIRDHIREPLQVRLIDKLSFTFGVIVLMATEYIFVQCPGSFWLWYSFVMPTLIFVRYFMYRRDHFQYFLLDFCYYSQLLMLLLVYVVPDSDALFCVCYAVALGPLSAAIMAWQNSMVFHSLDKITSVYLHAFPSLLMMDLHRNRDPDPGRWWVSFWLMPLLAYSLWQGLYYYKTEVLDRSRLDRDPRLVTSLRWLSRDKKNGMHRLVRGLMVRWGVMAKNEEFAPESVKTKVIFMASQLVYTAVTLLPVPLLFFLPSLRLGYVLLIYCWSIYSGASYYVDVFSKTYQKKFDDPTESSKE
jgi:hypothetical protein